MKLFTSIMAMFMAASIYAHSAHAATELADATAEKVLDEAMKEKDQVVVLTFYATWCPQCKLFEPMLTKAEKELPKVKFMRMDVDKNPQNGGAVPAVPATVIFKNKKVVDVMMGRAPSQKALEDRIKKAFGKK